MAAGKLRLGWPNRITIGRLLLVWPFALCLLYMNEARLEWLRLAAIGVFVMTAVSDLLDGYLARRLGEESPLGRFLDPLADKMLITVAVLILTVVGVSSLSGGDHVERLYLPRWAAVVAIGKDLVVCIGFLAIYFVTGRVFIQPRPIGKYCTAVQLALVLAMLLWGYLPDWLSGLPKVLWYLATGVAIGAALDYIRLGSRYVAATAIQNRQGPNDGRK